MSTRAMRLPDLPDLTTLAGWAAALTSIGIMLYHTYKRIVKPIAAPIQARIDAKKRARAEEQAARVSSRETITRTHQAVTEMREQLGRVESRLVITNEMTQIGFMHADTDGEVVAVDRLLINLTGRAPEQLVGRNWYSAIADVDRVRVIDVITNAIRNRAEMEVDFELICVRGIVEKVKMRVFPRRNSGGVIQEWMFVVQHRP